MRGSTPLATHGQARSLQTRLGSLLPCVKETHERHCGSGSCVICRVPDVVRRLAQAELAKHDRAAFSQEPPAIRICGQQRRERVDVSGELVDPSGLVSILQVDGFPAQIHHEAGCVLDRPRDLLGRPAESPGAGVREDLFDLLKWHQGFFAAQ